MAQRAFIAKVDLDAAMNLQEVIQTIWDALEDAGFAVISVDPWKSHDEIKNMTEQALGLGANPSILSSPSPLLGGTEDLEIEPIDPII